jgi:putative ABC transport system permease protein
MGLSILVMALRALRRNALRSVLTTLGIVIGVAAVMAMLMLGRGATAKVTSDIARLGKNLLVVRPGAERRLGLHGEPFTADDLRAIREEVPNVAGASPSSGAGARVVFGNRHWTTGITGADNSYFEVRDWPLAAGRTFSEAELESGAPACILGETPRQKLFGRGEALGETLRFSRISCLVVGVLSAKGQSTFGEDMDDLIVIPLRTFQRRISGEQTIGAIMVSAATEADTGSVQRSIVALLRQQRHLRDDEESDFMVRDMKDITQMIETVTRVLTGLLGAIAAISLLVGGIGIMNIMLVSVTERTREIGLRMAVGAQAHDVLAQFLVEAVALSCLGGVLGVLLGMAGTLLATRLLAIPFIFMPGVAAGAFGFAAVVGVGFGLFPALRASRLNPIEALRHE